MNLQKNAWHFTSNFLSEIFKLFFNLRRLDGIWYGVKGFLSISKKGSIAEQIQIMGLMVAQIEKRLFLTGGIVNWRNGNLILRII